jgi:hypothetical protein
MTLVLVPLIQETPVSSSSIRAETTAAIVAFHLPWILLQLYNPSTLRRPAQAAPPGNASSPSRPVTTAGPESSASH